MLAFGIIAAAVVAYALIVLVSPVTGCRRCRGFGTRGRKRRACSRCSGTGIRFRPGAPLMYRAVTGYRHHRANGNLDYPPLRPPRRRR